MPLVTRKAEGSIETPLILRGSGSAKLRVRSCYFMLDSPFDVIEANALSKAFYVWLLVLMSFRKTQAPILLAPFWAWCAPLFFMGSYSIHSAVLVES